MSKFHRNRKKHIAGQDKRAIWLLGVAAILLILLFAYI